MTNEKNMITETEQIARKCVDICYEAKAENIQLYDVSETSILSDYYLICNANSEPQIRALISRVDDEMAEIGVDLKKSQGTPASQWVILDFGVVLVHIFLPESREFYELEKLWKTGTLVYDSSELDG